jgi:hypothetical protein
LMAETRKGRRIFKRPYSVVSGLDVRPRSFRERHGRREVAREI